MEITKKYIDQLTYLIIGAAIEVHSHLGPGLLESVYEKCFVHELFLPGYKCQTQKKVPYNYKGLNVDPDLRYDVLVEDLVVVELKSNDGISHIHKSIVLTYMRLLEKPKSVIINFNCANIFKEGQVTLVNQYYAQLPE